MNRSEVQSEYEDFGTESSNDDDDDDTGSPSSCALIGQLTEEFWANDRAYFVLKRGKLKF